MKNEEGTTPMKSLRPGTSRMAAARREEAQQHQEGGDGAEPGTLIDMLRQLMTTTNAHLTATDEKLDTIGGRLVQNEVKIAHLEDLLEERDIFVTNWLDQHDSHLKERLRQQDTHIQDMADEHENYHKTVLDRLDEFGRAQGALQAQLAEQRRQREQEHKRNDAKIAELERGLKEARQAAEARQQSQEGVHQPGELILRVAGFDRGTPAEEIEKVSRQYLRLSKTATLHMQRSAEAKIGDSRVVSLFFLSSFALVNASAETARRIIAETRPHQGRAVSMGGQKYKLRVTLLKTKEERDRNRRLVRLEEAVHDGLKKQDIERKKGPWQLICWRTSTVVVHGKRTITLNKDHETINIGADDWWKEDYYSQTKDTIVQRSEEALANDLSR